MSSYLSFYLVPRKTKTRYNDKGEEVEEKISEGKPLIYEWYTRSSEVYQAYCESLNVAYCGMEDAYTELTPQMARQVANEFKQKVTDMEERLVTDYKIVSNGGYNEDLYSEIHSSEQYLKELKQTLNSLENIADFVDNIINGITDFEKVLINVD